MNDSITFSYCYSFSLDSLFLLKGSEEVNGSETENNQTNPLLINETETINFWESQSPPESESHFVLDIVNLVVREGNLVGVIGPVGSGKSTFLSALIGEINKIRGNITMRNIEGGSKHE